MQDFGFKCVGSKEEPDVRIGLGVCTLEAVAELVEVDCMIIRRDESKAWVVAVLVV